MHPLTSFWKEGHQFSVVVNQHSFNGRTGGTGNHFGGGDNWNFEIGFNLTVLFSRNPDSHRDTKN